MKIVFMGTPHFAIPALEKLIDSDHTIVGVFTKPAKPAGRGYKEILTPVHDVTIKHSLPVYTPSTFKDPNNVKQLRDLQPDVIVVTAYGLILRKEVLEIPKYGCINIHPSKLPRWRGAAPIQHTILSGDKETAVCIMQMDEGMDTGNILAQRDFEVPSKMTAKELHDLSANIGSEMLIETIETLEKGSAKPQKQSLDGITYANKINRDSEVINWYKTSFEIFNQIRTFSPKPGAFFSHNGENIKIITAEHEDLDHSFCAGEVVDDTLSIACAKGIIKPTLLQREGKKMIYTDAFLRGFPISKGTKLVKGS